VNHKRKVNKRPPTEHTLTWERLDEYKIGPRRTLRPGQVVKIHGVRAAEFEFMYAERHTETGAVNLTFVGGRNGHRMVRTFTPDRVSKFVRAPR
jgi:hypothetical protein